MSRSSEAVVKELLDEMGRIVRDYHPAVARTGTTLPELIAGTSMFPGGAGLWRGDAPFGPLPNIFPDAPVMIVGHNFDSMRAYEASKTRGGEADSKFWKILRGFLDAARLRPERCFFTNVLMGLKPGSALGPMPSVPGYEEQCRTYLLRQIQVVAPCALIALGNNAEAQLTKAHPTIPWMKVRHPSAREFTPITTRQERVLDVGKQIRVFLLGRGVELPASVQPLA